MLGRTFSFMPVERSWTTACQPCWTYRTSCRPGLPSAYKHRWGERYKPMHVDSFHSDQLATTHKTRPYRSRCGALPRVRPRTGGTSLGACPLPGHPSCGG